MNKLVASEFLRLRKSNLFKICLLASAGLGIYMVMMRWYDIKMNPEIYDKLSREYSNADGILFSGALYMIFMVAIFVSIFVGTEYSNGTMRNKIIVGHIRWNIYFSKFIVCAVADMIIYILCVVVVLIFGGLFIGGTTLSPAKIILMMWASTSSILALTALLLLLSMSIQSRTYGGVLCLMTTLILMFAAVSIYQRLSAPEYYDEYAYADENTGEVSMMENVKNPQYLTGGKRRAYEFLNDFIPVSQLYQIMTHKTDRLNVIVFYDLIIIIATTGMGMAIFKRKNLK